MISLGLWRQKWNKEGGLWRGVVLGLAVETMCSSKKVQSNVHLLSFLPFNHFAYHDLTNPLNVFCIHFSNNQQTYGANKN